MDKNGKSRHSVWLSDDVWREVDALYKLDNCPTRNEFVEKALRQYCGRLHAERTGAYLPRALQEVLEGTLGVFGDRLGRLLFKLVVEHTIAEAMRIQTDGLRWYAAYHDEGHHPHVHMMVWSTEPKKGYLTREGIATMRSRMTNAIFHEEMTELYIKKDAAYKESIQTAKESLLLYIRMLEGSESADPVIEQKLWELSHALEQVDGKHVYAYLPKEVKTQVDEIMERLAQLPEVAACYDQWWRLKDEIAGYYGRNIPPHQPLVQQKEFRAIKNFIIREAETICEPTPVQTSTDAEKNEQQNPLDEAPATVQQPRPEMPRTALTANAVMQLLLHMSRMFRGNMPVIPPALHIDSKRRRRLQEKRMATGHKRDDQEDERLYHVNDNAMQ